MSISEIAKHLKVSKSTVSLVINGKAEKGRISKVLAQRIRDYIEEIGYKPNALAKSLATGKSRTIGLIVENIGDSFFGPIALYIEEYLRKYEYQVLYSSTMGDNKLAAEIVQTMLDKHVDGIILSPTDGIQEEVQRIIQGNTPIVLFDRKIPGINTNYVGTNNYEASTSAIQHLLMQGYSNIGMVTIDSQQPQMQDRLQAYRHALEKQGHTPQVCFTSFREKREGPWKEVLEWLEKKPQLDALYFSTNYLCIIGLKAIQKLKKRSKLAVVTFDDHEVFELLQPQISCIRQPLEGIAKSIVHILLDQLKDRNNTTVEDIIPSELQIRQSSL
ncbi:LacI family DNA-binding transcriptional regulator [Sphingobacterium sp. SYP-B4668]|uniref:LacI family DNA-binding transcriptional regulator n=1 Tax=Sphingobacterium sp. SYP-B4668 TaxID=2996035 RepID=UPI0022DE48F9|nr:LacI family DNA-binding transcriptional regulator [Sphingobacterium sp. SYP-B4668]